MGANGAWWLWNCRVDDLNANSNAMRGRRETTHTAPRFFSRLPRTPGAPPIRRRGAPTLFPLPLTVQQKKIVEGAYPAFLPGDG